jgi:hypothetical protein
VAILAHARPFLCLRSSDLHADGGIGDLERRLRPRSRASADANEYERGDETANRSPVIGHRLDNSSREDATNSANINGPRRASRNGEARGGGPLLAFSR